MDFTFLTRINQHPKHVSNVAFPLPFGFIRQKCDIIVHTSYTNFESVNTTNFVTWSLEISN
jgi:hypothetical protein